MPPDWAVIADRLMSHLTACGLVNMRPVAGGHRPRLVGRPNAAPHSTSSPAPSPTGHRSPSPSPPRALSDYQKARVAEWLQLCRTNGFPATNSCGTTTSYWRRSARAGWDGVQGVGENAWPVRRHQADDRRFAGDPPATPAKRTCCGSCRTRTSPASTPARSSATTTCSSWSSCTATRSTRSPASGSSKKRRSRGRSSPSGPSRCSTRSTTSTGTTQPGPSSSTGT